MTPFKFAMPPKKPGVYVFKHEPSGLLYIGSTNSLNRRFQEWRAVINSGHYPKSEFMSQRLKVTKPDDWTFYVAHVYETVDEARAAEAWLVQQMVGKVPDKLLNTLELNNPKERGAACVPMTTITCLGGTLNYDEAATALGCTKPSLAKRLARYRANGVTHIAIELLQSRGNGRPKKEG